MDNDVPSPNNDTFTYNINKNFYTFQATLITISGPNDTKSQDIKPSAIKTLYIEDTYNNFYQNGYIIIDNSYDVIERDISPAADPSSPQYYSKGNTDGSSKNYGFLFKGEARDILRIDIMPNLDDTNFGELGSDEQQKYFRMIYDFAIYNSEEILGGNPDQKFKKLYFHELYYQLLTEKNVQFSTSDILKDKNAYLLDNTDRAVPTGIVLREFLKAAFPPEDNYPIVFAEEIDTTIVAPPDTELAPGTVASDYQNIAWDVGGSEMFFSTPATFKAIDSVNYILSRHVSTTNNNFDQCFLHLNRFPRQFYLTSISRDFLNAYNKTSDTPGQQYLETVKIGGYTQDNAQSFYDHAYTPTGGLYFEKFGTIKSFSFDTMPGLYSQQEIVSRFVHSYNYDNKQFNIDALRNSIEETMKVYKKEYVDCMISSSEYPPYTNFAPGQYRYLNKNIDNVFTVSNEDADQRLAFGRNRTLYYSVLTNNLISFRLPGSTHRQAGYFIGIDRDGAITSSKFDDKLLGIYLIIKVGHTFNDGDYYNDLHCIKTYNFNKADNTNGEGLISNSI